MTENKTFEEGFKKGIDDLIKKLNKSKYDNYEYFIEELEKLKQ